MEREELLRSKEYVVSGMQLQLLNLIEDYMKNNKLKRNELAKELNVTKGYVTQLLNVSFDHKMSKIVELALACNTMPLLSFIDIKNFIKEDAADKVFISKAVNRPRLEIVSDSDFETILTSVKSVAPVLSLNNHQMVSKLIS